MIVATVLLPDSLVASMQETQPDGTVVTNAPEAVNTRVAEGRKLPDSQAYNIRVKDEETMDALLSQYPEATLIGAWSEKTGEQVRPFDKTLWLDITPDNIETDENGENPVHVRPTEIQEFHKWKDSAERDLS